MTQLANSVCSALLNLNKHDSFFSMQNTECKC